MNAAVPFGLLGPQMTDSDPLEKLRPAPPTPVDELCSCAGSPALLLRSTLGPNPIACAACNLEVLPERLAISNELAESLAGWRSFHDCFYLLWLDSGEFEAWALRELTDPRSVVHARGLSVRTELEQVRRSYYWWFQDVGSDDFVALSSCPLCGVKLVEMGLVGLVCEDCSVLVAN